MSFAGSYQEIFTRRPAIVLLLPTRAQLLPLLTGRFWPNFACREGRQPAQAV